MYASLNIIKYQINNKLLIIITPIFKAGNTRKAQNYRPISVLPPFLKLLERLLYDTIYAFLQQN
ncbi:hypothetical protein CAPTEDRAFT_129624 [Capitella teleta]|uniref:Reverse transcriptase domain-containing protein n=1 Tax=Capitella teleta TaxID=283909 RepID=R7V1X5_CAPTE|nr:hypothetical protein CAPTEDRAFT_129624 [Capitella teleta]|eukprot:ELU09676.1 hypothetical protein CAPTEDRAFT_129624 [Capitella teleta]